MNGSKASICLTAYNEERGIQRVLDYISSQSSLIEDIVVVSDACHDKTDRIVEEWASRGHPFKISLFMRKGRYGRGNAIHLGLAQTRNDLNIILAADMQPFPDAFKNLLRYFQDSKIGAVTGHPILLNGEKTIGDCLNHIMWSSHNRASEILSLRGQFFHLFGEVYAIRKSALKPTDNFQTLNEDNMIGYLIKRNGYLVLWARDVKYYMTYPRSFSGWLKVRKRSCYGRVDIILKTGIKAYYFNELKNPEYICGVAKIALSKPKFLASLAVGTPFELLARLYYWHLRGRVIPVNNGLWEPARDTKW